MAKPYSADLRSRVLAAMEAGEPPSAVAGRFVVGRSTAYRWRHEQRREGRTTAKHAGGGKAPVIQGIVAEMLRQLVAERNDRTLAEYGNQLAERTGVRASTSMLCRAFQALRLPRKKEEPAGGRTGRRRGSGRSAGLARGVGEAGPEPAGVP